MKTKSMFTIESIFLGPARNQYQIGLLFTLENSLLRKISVTEQSCAAPASVKCAVQRFGVVWKGIPTVAEVNKEERGLESTEDSELPPQALSTNYSGTMFDVCEAICSDSVPLLFTLCRTAFRVILFICYLPKKRE